MPTNQPRVPAGVAGGGQYAPDGRPRSVVTLAVGDTDAEAPSLEQVALRMRAAEADLTRRIAQLRELSQQPSPTPGMQSGYLTALAARERELVTLRAAQRDELLNLIESGSAPPTPAADRQGRSVYQAALAEFESAQQRLEAEAGKVLAAQVREYYPDAVSIRLRWNETTHGVDYGYGVFDAQGRNIEEDLENTDEDAYAAFVEEVHETAWHLRSRLDNDDDDTVVIPLVELETATVEGD